jgi:hypothetical protein
MAGRIKSMKNIKDPIKNQSHDLLACSTVDQPTVLPHTPNNILNNMKHVKLNISKLEQNSNRHDYNIQKRSDLKSKFCTVEILKKC